MSRVRRKYKHPEYTEISTMERDMSGLFKVLGMKVNRYKRGLIVNTNTHSYQLEIEDENKNRQL